MRIGLVDVDGHNFPSLPLMKLSAWHKQQGDTVRRMQRWVNMRAVFEKVKRFEDYKR